MAHHVGGASPLLEVSSLSLQFGGIKALNDISFQVEPAAICGIIGPNGAGKTSLFNCLSRLYTPQSGTILLNGQDTLALPQHRMIELGVGRTFQNVALFPGMTVRENILVGLHWRLKASHLTSWLRLPVVRREEADAGARADALLRRLSLSELADVPVARLNFGTRKRIELARALISEPKLLLLDEPAAGLNHDGVEELRDFMLRIRDEFGTAILLVEHHLNLVMRVADQVVAMNFGVKIADGRPEEVRQSKAVIEAYLGSAA